MSEAVIPSRGSDTVVVVLASLIVFFRENRKKCPFLRRLARDYYGKYFSVYIYWGENNRYLLVSCFGFKGVGIALLCAETKSQYNW